VREEMATTGKQKIAHSFKEIFHHIDGGEE
jgi:hypothetical protein